MNIMLLHYYIANIRYLKNGKTYFENRIVVANRKEAVFETNITKFHKHFAQYVQDIQAELQADSIENIDCHRAIETNDED